MADDADRDKRYASLPLPTYEEATSSRPSSSSNFRGAEEISDDAERQGLLRQLQQDAGRRRGVAGSYYPPTVESARPSVDSDLSVRETVHDNDSARRHVEELDYLDANEPDRSRRSARLYHRARIRGKFSRNLSSLRATLSALRLPTFRARYSAVAQPASEPPATAFLSRLRPNLRIPEQFHISAPTFARLCALLTLVTLVYILFALDVFPSPSSRRMAAQFDPESVRAYVQEHVSADDIQAYLYHITSFDHVAGTEGDLYLAKWMEGEWAKAGGLDELGLLEYYVYLNYPTKEGRSVSLVDAEGKATWVAQLEEEDVYPDRLDRKQTLAWHGHSKSGEVEGPLVFANGGSREDFAWLRGQGIVTNGSVAIVRYYGTQGNPALKIKAAEEAGCVGVLMYSDPADDGAGRGAVWPDGPWRPEDSVQRAGVSAMNWVVGDPLTPGRASTLDAPRESKQSNPALPHIPSLPLAWRDAEVLLRALHGHGVPAPANWVGGTQDFHEDWYTGNAGPGSSPHAEIPMLHLKSVNDESEKQRIWNLHGLVKGIESPSEKIIIGNHRDSWCFGSVDPGSGSAVMMEVVSIFAQLRKLGWRPLRTVEFVSWDAGEFNLAGSTEYVEDNAEYLREHGVAYLNVGAGVSGSVFKASGSPVWQRALLRVLDRVSDASGNSSLRQLWDARGAQLEPLGAEASDSVPFLTMAGMSSLDFGFQNSGEGERGYPYRSCYESFEWMQRFGDPGFGHHRALAQVWALLILEVADAPILPFGMGDYADKVKGYVDGLETEVGDAGGGGGGRRGSDEEDAAATFSLQPLHEAAGKLQEAAHQIQHSEDLWQSQVLSGAGGAGGPESASLARKGMEYNKRLARFESGFLDLPTSKADERAHGLRGREQFKHVVFGPRAWGGAGEQAGVFPGVRDQMGVGDWKGAGEMVELAAQRIERAAADLVE